MAELRREPILQRWVAITGQRWEVLSELLRQRREDGCGLSNRAFPRPSPLAHQSAGCQWCD